MPTLIQPVLRLKNGGEIAAALRRASIVTGKLPADLANRFALSVAIRARKNLPAASTAEIRSELGEVKAVELVRTRRGRFSRAKKHEKSFFTGGNRGAPYLALIMQAAVNPSSRYNLITNRRFARDESPFKGGHMQTIAGRRVWDAATQAKVLGAMRKIFSARLTSAGFLRVCAGVVMTIFRSAGNKTKSPPPATTGTAGKLTKRIGKIAGGQVATGTGKATANFWVGDPLSASNDYLQAMAQPVWDKAMADELKSLRDYTAKKEYKIALEAAGFKVK